MKLHQSLLTYKKRVMISLNLTSSLLNNSKTMLSHQVHNKKKTKFNQELPKQNYQNHNLLQLLYPQVLQDLRKSCMNNTNKQNNRFSEVSNVKMTILTISLMTHMKETSIWEASFDEAISRSLEYEDQWGKTKSQENWLIFF